jgi:hypothetical protein
MRMVTPTSRTLSGITSLIIAAASCSGVIQERDGEGPLFALSGDGLMVSTERAASGETWSAGSIPLCKRDPASTIVLTGIEALRVSGQVRLEGVGVRTTRWGLPDGPSDPDTHMVGIHRGTPTGVRSPRGYEVPTSCSSSKDPVGEIVVTLTKTGDAGGMLDGLRVTYEVAAEEHVFDLQFGFALCGTGKDALQLCDTNGAVGG